MIINISLDNQGIASAISQLTTHKQEVINDTHKLVKELAEDARDIVEDEYMQAFTNANYNETKPFSVDTIPYDKGYRVVADGDSVVMYEFGAGVTAGNNVDSSWKAAGARQGIIASPMGWSRRFSKLGKNRFHVRRHPFWYFNGHRYTGIMPTNGMYHATKYISRVALSKARRIFK